MLVKKTEASIETTFYSETAARRVRNFSLHLVDVFISQPFQNLALWHC